MKKRLIFVLCSIFIAVGFVAAQTARRTVTNADLEKFRQKRLLAEKSYRENYERLGFPSPEELEARNERDRQTKSALSTRIERENYDRERIRREEEMRQSQARILYNYANQNTYNGGGYYPQVYSGGFFGGFGGFSGFNNFGGYGYYKGKNNFGSFGFGRRGNFYDSIQPGTVAPPRNGVRINTNPIRISVTPRAGFGSGGRVSGGIVSPR